MGSSRFNSYGISYHASIGLVQMDKTLENERLIQRSEAVWHELCIIFKKVSFTNLSWSQVKFTAMAYGRLSNNHVSLNLLGDEWKQALSRLQQLNTEHLIRFPAD